MNEKIGKTYQDLAFFNARLDEVRMSEHERLRAKALMAQSEAAVDGVLAFIGFGKRMLKPLSARSMRHPTASAS